MTESLNLPELARDVAVEVLKLQELYEDAWLLPSNEVFFIRDIFSPQGRDLIEKAMREKGCMNCSVIPRHGSPENLLPKYSFIEVNGRMNGEAYHQNKHIACALAALKAVRSGKDDN